MYKVSSAKVSLSVLLCSDFRADPQDEMRRTRQSTMSRLSAVRPALHLRSSVPPKIHIRLTLPRSAISSHIQLSRSARLSYPSAAARSFHVVRLLPFTFSTRTARHFSQSSPT